MKRIMKLLVVLMAGAMLAGCGGKEQTVTMTTDTDGVKIEMVISAKGDTVTKTVQTSTMETSGLPEEQVEQMQGYADSLAETMGAMEAAEYKSEITDGEFKEVITIDMTNKEALDELVAAGISPVEGTTSRISLKKTVEALESQGWTKAK